SRQIFLSGRRIRGREVKTLLEILLSKIKNGFVVFPLCLVDQTEPIEAKRSVRIQLENPIEVLERLVMDGQAAASRSGDGRCVPGCWELAPRLHHRWSPGQLLFPVP